MQEQVGEMQELLEQQDETIALLQREQQDVRASLAASFEDAPTQRSEAEAHAQTEVALSEAWQRVQESTDAQIANSPRGHAPVAWVPARAHRRPLGLGLLSVTQPSQRPSWRAPLS